MNARDIAEQRMQMRIDTGEPFMSSDLVPIAEKAGLNHHRASAAVNAFTQRLKRLKVIKPVDRVGTAYIWQHAASIPARIPDEPAKVRAPVVVGPYDPPPALEGPNSGLTEAYAEHLWHRIGGGDRTRTLKENVSVMEARGWREVAADGLKFLFDRGFVGPAGAREYLDPLWSYAWVYEASNWEIVDSDDSGVALVLNDRDVPLILAAPAMASAIRTVVERFRTQGGVKRSDIEALAAALPPETPPAAPAAPTEEEPDHGP